jgi:quercetin dioxygenase-like cupin family protein
MKQFSYKGYYGGKGEMKIENVPFCTIDWNTVKPTIHPGITGEAYWRTFEQGNVRVRIVEYTPGYMADHWCSKGHVLYVLDGELTTELSDGSTVILKPGCSYQVADDIAPHRSKTDTGALLLVVD